MFTGSITALITPFKDGALDEDAFCALVEWQISQGVHGLVPVGTTGESPTLTHAEHERVIDLCLEVVAGRVPVIAGAGSNATAEAVSLANHARQAGAQAALLVTPYYNKPSQDGLYAHYKTVAQAVDIPIIVYTVPGRTNVDVEVATMARLAADCPNIIGIKDATADLTRPLALRNAIDGDFCLLSGEDATLLAYLANGGHGCISVTANVAPKLCAQMYAAWANGDAATALAITDKLFPLHQALFLEPSPQGVKYAAALIGKSTEEVRLPLVELGGTAKKAIEDAMRFAGLI